MKTEIREQLRSLMQQYRITFDKPSDHKTWPARHESVFSDVRTLGATVFDDYNESSVVDSINKPWKRNTKRRAIRLAALAGRAQEEDRNEAGWRMALESEAMARFTIEVAW